MEKSNKKGNLIYQIVGKVILAEKKQVKCMFG